MQAFSITCQSCAVKLKVTRESAIGQLLACPKCGTMIHVNAPAGYTPTPQHASQESAHFDDIDSILGTGPDDAQPKTKNRKSKSKSKKTSTKNADHVPAAPLPRQVKAKIAEKNRPSKTVPEPKLTNAPQPTASQRTKKTASGKSSRKTTAQSANASANAGSSDAARLATKKTSEPNRSKQASTTTNESPLLPNEQWTSEATQNRKRTVRLISMAIGGVLLTMVLCYALLQYLNPAEPVAIVPDKGVEIVSPDEDNPIVDANNDVDNLENEIATDDMNNDLEIDPTPPAIDDAPPVAELPTVADDPPAVEVPTTINDPSATLDMDKPKVEFDDSVPIGTVPAVGDATEATDSNPADSIEEDNSLGKLSELLEKSGTSILEIQDLALAERDRFGVGQPRYFIEPVEHDPVNFDRQEKLPIDGAQFKSVSLRQTLSELTALSGLTFSIDAVAASRAGVAPNPRIDLTVEGQTVVETAATIAASGSMTIQKVETGFVLRSPFDATLIETAYDVKPVVGEDPELVAEFSELLQTFVAEGTWSDQAAPTDASQPGIAIDGTTLKVTQSKWAHSLIADLISAMTIFKEKRADQAVLENNRIVVASSVADGSPLSKPPQLKLTMRRTLSQLFEELEANTEVSVLANWNELARSGWTPDSLAPGRINEPTANDLIRQIAHSMGLTVYVVDEKNVVLTTFEDAATYFDLRVYSTNHVSEKGITRAELERLITESLGAQLRSSGVNVRLIDSCKSLVVRAPQSLHRQIETVLGRFK